MATNEHGKRKSTSDHREGLRKTARTNKTRGGDQELHCPICEVTLWEGKVQQHYQQELAKLKTLAPSLAHSKKRRCSANAGEGKGKTKEQKLIEKAEKTLESVRRRSIRFEQGSNLASGAAGSSGEDARTCPVCALSLPSDASAAEAHVDACLGEGGGAGGEDSSDSEVYEEYTWCNVTRVRATSMLTPEARANMFDGTIISKGNSGQGEDGEMVDVEDDETATYGPPQYSERDVKESLQAELDVSIEGEGYREEEVKSKHQDSQQCLICMDQYRNPLVSVKCWHVYCDKCWLQALASKKVCPKCKDITSPSDLRKIFL